MSYVASYFHCVFGTKERRPLIPPSFEARLWPYLGGIAQLVRNLKREQEMALKA